MILKTFVSCVLAAGLIAYFVIFGTSLSLYFIIITILFSVLYVLKGSKKYLYLMILIAVIYSIIYFVLAKLSSESCDYRSRPVTALTSSWSNEKCKCLGVKIYIDIWHGNDGTVCIGKVLQ